MSTILCRVEVLGSMQVFPGRGSMYGFLVYSTVLHNVIPIFFLDRGPDQGLRHHLVVDHLILVPAGGLALKSAGVQALVNGRGLDHARGGALGHVRGDALPLVTAVTDDAQALVSGEGNEAMTLPTNCSISFLPLLSYFSTILVSVLRVLIRQCA